MDRPMKDFLAVLLACLLGVAAAFTCLFFFGKWGILIGSLVAIVVINSTMAVYKRVTRWKEYENDDDN